MSLAIAVLIYPGAWVLAATAAMAAAFWTEAFLGRRLLQVAPGPAMAGRARWFVAAHLAAALVVAAVLGALWWIAPADEAPVPFMLTVLGTLWAGTAAQQAAGLALLRQGLVIGGPALVVAVAAVSGALQRAEVLAFASLLVLAGVAFARNRHLARAEAQHRDGKAAGAAALARAERGAEEKTVLLAAASHEMRGMLNGVLGMAQLLLRSNLTAAQRQQAEVIAESGRSLEAFLSDLLDLSKLEAGQMRILPEPANLASVVARIERQFRASADAKGLGLRASVADDTPPTLLFDSVRLAQCLGNLVSNAIKFTAHGSVRIAATVRPLAGDDDALPYRIEVEVADTGIGIAPEHRARLFRPFAQADETIARRFGGSGLGLCITRQVAEAMGGGVDFDSTPGAGSVFRLWIAADAVPDGGAAADRGVALAD